jgi:aspartyl-tRNA(Asn)/glutamyl-tRNA(Gln) amidotransferase subunit A
MAPAALGSDTGGSIRQPAALCGVVGLKPTYGLVSRCGLVAFGSSLEQIGPMARTPEDCALLLDLMAGRDERDSTSADAGGRGYLETARRDPRPFRFGVPPEYLGEGLDAGVRSRVGEALGALEEIGGERFEVGLPHTEHGIAVYYLIATAEASSNLARYDGVRYGARAGAEVLEEMYERTRGEGFGDEAKRRIMLGAFALSAGYHDAYYLRASRVRSLVARDFEDAFERVDVIATPATPTTAFRLGERLDDPLAMYLSDAFTVPANLAGLPALSVPCGLDPQGLPVGLQLVGPPLSEGRLLSVARAFLEARPFAKGPPGCDA